MSPRRRRDGVTVRARIGGAILSSRKGSNAAEGTSVHSTASPFAGRYPRWTSTRAKSLEALQASRRIVRVTRVPEALRGGHARTRFKSARQRLHSSASARNLALCHESGNAVRESHRVRGRGSQAPYPATDGERPTQPASVGAGEQRSESSTRVRGSNARRVCPRVVSGCRSRQATPRLREA